MKKTLEYSKNIQLRVSPEFHKQLKMYCAENGISLQDFVVSLIRDKFRKLCAEKDKENV
jgi:predicted HicB family RNase H-like nuclease